jgi:cellulose synthase/poly-beta-1,6-N-acetylglucosamine synthase-like glycosyltransferase
MRTISWSIRRTVGIPYEPRTSARSVDGTDARGRRMTIAFWAAVGAIIYTYIGFPLLLAARAAVRPRPVASGEITPTVTVIVAAYNEEQDIGEKLQNLASCDYPPDHVQIIVASDGSDDDTEDIVRAHARTNERVCLLALPRVGKAGALNAAIEAAEGEILVFSDANSLFDPDALRALVRPFADPEVGAVAGDQRYIRSADTGAVAEAEERYWNLDRWLKLAGSRAGNVTSATGAIHAIRRELVDPVPEGVTDDFFLSTGAIVHGRRLVFAPDAITREPVAASASAEFGRKTRIVARGLRSVRARSELLSLRRHGFYAVQLWSHKVLRRLMFVPLLICLITSLGGALQGHRTLALAATLQLSLYGAAGLGGLVLLAHRRPIRVLRLPLFFVLVNVAAASAVHRVARGAAPVQWEPHRHTLSGGGSH